jgi:hypothetical protein
MLPHKHYPAHVIEKVLQNQEAATVLLNECVAEESTLRRWMQEFPQKLSALAASLESLVNISRVCLLPPLQRIYEALSLLINPPLNHSRLAWAFFVGQFQPNSR